jgi:hypothetical protein
VQAGLQGEEWYEMKSRFAVFLMSLLLVLTWFAYSPATVEWDVSKTLKTEQKPLDAAISANARWIFVLTEGGEVLIYSSDGTLKEKISVGESIDGIKAGPREDILLLTSRKDSTVQFITLDFVQDINVSGSPFKGQADAPVVISTYTDFQ